MRILVDGYNLIRRIPELRELDRTDLEEGRRELLRELAAYRAGKGHRITVVFDGTGSIRLGGSSGYHGGISVHYSPRGRSADSVIKEMCREGGTEILISDDRELTGAARRAGATPVSTDLFWDKVQAEMYRRLKGEEEGEQGQGRRAKGGRGRKLSKEQRRDRSRIEKL